MTDREKRPSQRLVSLDALRGFDMFFIMGGGALFVALAQLLPYPFFQTLAEQMGHVAWNGYRFYDIIFPLFLYIAGISFPFSLEKQRSSGRSDGQIRVKVIKRGLTLVALGILYNGLLQFDFETMRYASVLGRIGLAWMFGALIYMHSGRRGRVVALVAILVGYWLLMALVPVSDPAGRYSPEGALTGVVDRALLPGRLHNGIHDPEGILSTVPAVATALLGMLTGLYVKRRSEASAKNSGRYCLNLVAVGVVLIAVGYLWSTVFPINKSLWSSSFVCVVGGISMLLFTLFHYVIDILKWQNGQRFLPS